MKISIIIPNYNGAHLLEDCIRSIIGQRYTNHDITVVDNGSTDNSLMILKNYPSVRTIELDQNIGFGKAVNKGIDITDGDLLFVLNNDTVLDQGCLGSLIDAINAFPTYAIYAPRINDITQRNEIYAAGLMFSVKGYGNRSQRYALRAVTEPMEVFGACGAAAIFRRSVLGIVGYFNEDYFLLNEDLELCFRHQLLGHKCLYIPSAVVFHHGGATLQVMFPVAVTEAVKNTLMTLIVCTPKPFLTDYAGSIIKFYLCFWFTIARRGYVEELITALTRVVFRSKSLLAARRRLQKQSKFDEDYLRSLLYRGEIEINFLDGVSRL
jgi:GT2 family glycosyltransferase